VPSRRSKPRSLGDDESEMTVLVLRIAPSPFQ
jgi:hypothetical protein